MTVKQPSGGVEEVVFTWTSYTICPAVISLLALPALSPKSTPVGHDAVAAVPADDFRKPLSPTRILFWALYALPNSACQFVVDTVTVAAETAMTRIARTTFAVKYQVRVRRAQLIAKVRFIFELSIIYPMTV